MNIILEYANQTTSICDEQILAEQWQNLSTYSLTDPDYCSRLQTITDYVTAMNAAPTQPNGSALRSLRTNEKMMEFLPSPPASLNSFQSNLFNDSVWNAGDWELRQFALDGSTHLLAQMPVANTPYSQANCMTGINTFNGNSGVGSKYCPISLDVNNFPGQAANRSIYLTIGNWVQLNSSQVASGNFNIPATYGGANILDGSARVSAEFLHYFNVMWPTAQATPANSRQVRQQYSLGTCQGCHSGETKTLFTHVQPVFYGESATYWNPSLPPDERVGSLDVRFEQENQNGNYPKPASRHVPPTAVDPIHQQKISAFLTGRSYRGPGMDANASPVAGNYDDDDPTDANDTNLDGLFYVNDPTNGSTIATNTPSLPNIRWGYNDLLRRKMDLCQLLYSDCLNPRSSIFFLFGKMAHLPFPIDGH